LLAILAEANSALHTRFSAFRLMNNDPEKSGPGFSRLALSADQKSFFER
jgi:hypothetical protein